MNDNCTKTKFATQQYAEDFIKKLKQTSTRKFIPQRAYLCNHCLCWHVTSDKNKHWRILELEEIIETQKKEFDIEKKALNDNLEKLQKEFENLRKKDNKSLRLEMKADDRIKHLDNRIEKYKETERKLRNTISELVSKMPNEKSRLF